MITNLVQRFSNYFSSFCYFDIIEIDGFSVNELYNAVQIYLSSSASVFGNRLSLTRALNSTTFTFGLSNNDRIVDTFRGVTVWWEHVVIQTQSQSLSWRSSPNEKRFFTLRILKKDKSVVLDTYLDHIMEKATELRRKNKDRLLYTNSHGGSMDSRGGNPWEAVPFKHPSTFDTLAMDPDKKEMILEDLRDFVDGKFFYQNRGRAWKRGYLLYGPPGTGKSSMIAAMANFLQYDIYDLELTEVNTNSDLRKLLMKTTSKSIIVIEDIDCSANLQNRACSKIDSNNRDPAGGGILKEGSSASRSITLSGLLNFTDGLWSCCGSERLFVFTTNHIERLDPALLRSGRMDMHIFMSHCTFPSLKVLMKNYLGWIDGDDEDVNSKMLLQDLEKVICAAEMTPADISEILIKNRRKDTYSAMSELLQILKYRRSENNNMKKNIRVSNDKSVEEKYI